jgi:hypothetical protein
MKNIILPSFIRIKFFVRGRHNQSYHRVKTLLFQASFLHAYHWCSIVSKLTTTSINLNQQSFINAPTTNQICIDILFFWTSKLSLHLYQNQSPSMHSSTNYGHFLHQMQYQNYFIFYKIICNGITMQMFDSILSKL